MAGFIFQFFLLLLSFFLGAYFQKIPFSNQEYAIAFLIWLLTLWLTHKHKPKYYQKKVKYILSPFFRAYVIQIILTIVLLFFLKINGNQIKLIITILLIYSALEVTIYFIFIKVTSNKDIRTKEIVEKKYLQEKLVITKLNFVDLRDIEENQIEFSKELLFKLYVNENPIFKGEYIICKTEIIDISHKTDLLIFNFKINDVKNINRLLTKSYNAVNNGGFIIVGYKDLDEVEDELSKKKGLIKFFKKVKYYLFDRAFPKIPILSKVHSILTNNKNKVISKTEVWGRLAYHGFDVKREFKELGYSYLIAQKDKTPSQNPNPSYLPLIRLNRVGLYGKIIKIYKVRSMYPYSEFLQEKVYEMNNLTTTGKFGEDYRITKLGKIYRKYWLDELPQLLDWLRGTIKLVGIRAMSQHYFSLYSKEYQDLYVEVKPGIISPIFDDKTDSFKDIQRIEKEYLVSYLKSPIKTDFKYFFITLNHILKGVRSK